MVSQDAIHRLLIGEVYTSLETRPSGLESSEATERLTRYGRNTIHEAKHKPIVFKLFANFTHLMALLLWVGGAVALVAQLPQLAIAIWLVNIINGVFSFWQEYRAEKATEALKRLLPAYARVLRDGQEQRVLAQELVPGDVMLLTEGDHVSADARVVEEAELQVNQSTLTGEAHPVRRTNQAVLKGDLSRVELPNLVFAGTSVVSGVGKAVVLATGMNTEFGRIAHLTQSLGEEESPLQKEMVRVTKVVTAVAVGVGLLFFLAAVLAVRISLAESFIFALGMIVAFVPEGLLPTVTLSLAMGVQRMAKRHALIKKLSAVETLGCTSVICTDKTGTLTQNEMTVRSLWVSGHSYQITGNGYAPDGEILYGDHTVQQLSSDLLTFLVVAGLCNNARLLPPNDAMGRWTILGDPTEAALLVLAHKAGIDLSNELKRRPRIRELPFESRRKRMSTIHRNSDTNSHVAYVKGAPHEVLNLCVNILYDGQERILTDELRMQVTAVNDDYARNGLRVLAVAQRYLPEDGLSDYSSDTIERDLTFLGLVAMMDPPRSEVADAVAKCFRAGIRIIMITGDYGLTAESIARRIGIIRGEKPRIVTGVELDKIDDHTLRQLLTEEIIFARVAPEHKMRVVGSLQAMGHVVAVTGDGVNDAPALKKADIGVAMGVSGTDVAKEAADMILTDDNFASIVNAVEEGRGVYANIRKFITYIFTSNTPEAVPFILFAFSGGRIPLALNVMQILSIDLGTDMVPALALGADAPEPGVMDEPPRNLKEPLITPALLRRAYLWLGSAQSLAAMAAFYFVFWMNGYFGQWIDFPASGLLYQSATAMTLAAVVTTQIGNVFTQRTERESILRVSLFNNRLLWIGIAVELIVVAAVIYLLGFQGIFDTAAFPPQYWLFLFAWTPSLIVVDELRKYLARRRARRKKVIR